MTHVALLSLEPWDEVWRRNQHLASRLVDRGSASSLTFVTPPTGGLATQAARWSPHPGITVVTPPLVVPRRFGGHRVLGEWLRYELRGADVIWVNDPVAGASVINRTKPMAYDVTDDWRSMPQPEADRLRIIRAEDRLAAVAHTVVCSSVLHERWLHRYRIDATVIPNGVDVRAIRAAAPHALTGPGPHAVYVGTLHENRIDLDLVRDLITEWPGTVHLVGPWHLPVSVSTQWRALGADIVGPVASADVPAWLNAADVLICPHRVDDFTLSLDAIKAHEYLATDRPVVATPSCGFQLLSGAGLSVVGAEGFLSACQDALAGPAISRTVAVDWDERTSAFAAALGLGQALA
ncbi:hypothetical protein Back2_13730 [Nocardioides baekrokdamisoli]|uniref:Uncharacterized protein n=1 Tax=Nocardioides baekrokdamisoli TaxID=1804624 RepID=A0A3G9IFA0_9ACTN|nr:glycosyltransferase [Nocardioides baekrokdamisoli]BBH17086.1 hypothetical protein Back2_13730 [Nocardioides baekrokdamisoli]